jgi:hypothetical protein
MSTESNINPHSIFTVWTPDEVAECMIPISEHNGTEVYDKIWTKIMPLLPNKYDSHGEILPKYEAGEVYEEESLAAFWSHFTEDEQISLNGWADDY